ncbi:MAG: thiamine pyrophosphate-dependent dehydrogenase E1 component subunit alpha [Eubacterium sp.]
MNYSNEELLRMYYHLAKARAFTLKMHEAVNAGYIRSSFHTPWGQEAIAVGSVCALQDNDWIAPTHRDQCASIMRFDNYEFIAEIMAKEDGMANGTGFDYHISDFSDGVRMLCPLGCLGGMIPLYAGFAWALKRDGKDDVVLVFHGDGGCSEGTAYEGWNLAALYKAPIVYVVENNEWAMTVPLERQRVNPDVSDSAAALGLPTQIVDGNDILKVREVMDKAVAMARAGQPNVVEMKTLRWEAHFVGQGNDYRPDKNKIQEYKEYRDCLVNYEKYLLDNGVCDEEYMTNLKKQFDEEYSEMLERAAKSGIAKKENVYTMDHVYATVETGGEL